MTKSGRLTAEDYTTIARAIAEQQETDGDGGCACDIVLGGVELSVLYDIYELAGYETPYYDADTYGYDYKTGIYIINARIWDADENEIDIDSAMLSCIYTDRPESNRCIREYFRKNQ